MAEEMDRGSDGLAAEIAGSTHRVAALGSLDDFEVAEDFADPRGWDVLASDGQRVGKVHELIVDTSALRTRYLDVQLEEDAALNVGPRDVLVPIGAARLDDNHDRVLLESMDRSAIAALPVYDHSEITRDYESSVVTPFSHGAGATEASSATGDTFYSGQNFDDSRFYSSRWGARRTDESSQVADHGVMRSEQELAVGRERLEADELRGDL